MKKESKKVYLIAFWALILFSIVSIINIFRVHLFEFSIPGSNFPREEIKINVTLDKKINDNFFICYNDYCESLNKDMFLNVLSNRLDATKSEFYRATIKDLYILYPKKYINSINDISMFVGNKKYFYSKNDISKFEKKDVNLKLDEDSKALSLNSISLPKINNYKGVLNHFVILILSLFYKAIVFLIPYFWLYIAYLIWNNKLKENESNITNQFYPYILGLIFVLGIIFRLNQINYYPLWLDEIYIKTVGIKSFLSCLSDAGNPPLFSILEFIVSKISSCDWVLRIIPFAFGVMFIYLTYLIFKRFSKAEAIFGAFFASFNLINIYHSSDIRSYSMCMALCLLLTYLIFKYIKNPSSKNLIFYTIASIAAINTHYYFTFLIFANFCYAIAALIDNDDKKQIPSFVLGNIVAAVSFIPYLVIVHKTALSEAFNRWIEPISVNTFSYIIKQYFINKYVFLILCLIILAFVIIYYLPEKIRMKLPENYKQKEELLMYLVYTIIFVLILVCLVSIFIKPILHKRILLSIYSLVFLGEITLVLIFYQLKLRFVPIVLMFMFFVMTKPMTAKEQYRFDDFMYFVQNDINQYSMDYQIHCITNDTKDYLSHYPDIKDNKRIVWHFVDTNALKHIERIKKSDYIEKGSKGVIYFHDMSANIDMVTFMNPNAYIYQTNSNRIAKIVFKGEK